MGLVMLTRIENSGQDYIEGCTISDFKKQLKKHTKLDSSLLEEFDFESL